MRYLVTTSMHEPFFTDYFSIENNFCEGMVVYDIAFGVYYDGGEKWKEISLDHL